MSRRLEKLHRKQFAYNTPFPVFSFYGHKNQRELNKGVAQLDMNKRPKLTLYGEINEEELLVNKELKLQE